MSFFPIHCNSSPSCRKATFARNLSVQSLLFLAIFCTTNGDSHVLVKEMPQNFENSWKKTQFFLKTLYQRVVVYVAKHRERSCSSYGQSRVNVWSRPIRRHYKKICQAKLSELTYILVLSDQLVCMSVQFS